MVFCALAVPIATAVFICVLLYISLVHSCPPSYCYYGSYSQGQVHQAKDLQARPLQDRPQHPALFSSLPSSPVTGHPTAPSTSPPSSAATGHPTALSTSPPLSAATGHPTATSSLPSSAATGHPTATFSLPSPAATGHPTALSTSPLSSAATGHPTALSTSPPLSAATGHPTALFTSPLSSAAATRPTMCSSLPGVSAEHDIQPHSAPSLAPSEDDETPRVVLGEDGDFIDREEYVAEGDDEGGLIMTEGELTDDVGAPPRKRKKTSPVFLSDEQERMLGEWVQEHPFLYDRGLPGFKDVGKKSSLFEEKARSLDPPLTVTQLNTWLRSIRTRYGRLTKVKSDQAARDLTAPGEVDSLGVFFFGWHIVRQKKPKPLGLREVRELCFDSQIPFFFFCVCVCK